MVATTRSVRVEVAQLDAVLTQVPRGRTHAGDAAGGRDVIRGDRVPQQREHARVLDVTQLCRLGRHVDEEGWLADVRRVVLPHEQCARGGGKLLPVRVAIEDARVLAGEHVSRDRAAHRGAHFLVARPEIGQEHVLALDISAQRLPGEIDVEPARQRERDDERRRGQIRRLHLRVDATLEVAVAAQHRGHREIVRLDALRDGFEKWTAVADARRAAVADEVEAQCVERAEQPGALEIVGDHAGARRKRGLDILGRAKPALGRVAREKAGRDHHGWIRGVGARRDGGDDDRAVAHRRGVVGIRGDGGDRLCVWVDAALLDEPGQRVGIAVGAVRGFAAFRGITVLPHRGERVPHARQWDTVLRALRSGDAWLHGGQVELEHLAEDGRLRLVGAKHVLRLAVPLDERDMLGLPTAVAQIPQRLIVDGEERGGGAELG